MERLFIEKAAPSLPKSAMYRAIRTKKIKLNGQAGDRFRVYTPDGRLTIGEIMEYKGILRLGAKIFF